MAAASTVGCKLTIFLCAIAFSVATAGIVPAIPNLDLKNLTASDERIRSHGYPAESHFLETDDGYVLNLFRIPHSHKLDNAQQYRPVILLQHGLLSNSDAWLSSGPDHALAYLFADAGYDVWLGNARGNIYSRKNTRVSLNHPKFWHFSWHEIALIDIASMIDYITEVTGESSLHYAGHSQGTTVFFVLMSERPEYNAKIKSAHMLAPCAYFGHSNSIFFDMLAPLVGTPNSMWNTLLRDMELFPQNNILNRLADTYCSSVDPAVGTVCRNLYVLFAGNGYQNVNVTSLQVLIETHPAGSSTNQAIHYTQLHMSKEFRAYDYGAKKNQQLYNQTTPPNYDLSQITAPTYLYSSAKDVLCVPADVDVLVKNMPQLKGDYRIPVPSWNHLDFIVASRMKEMLNDRVIETCNVHEKNL